MTPSRRSNSINQAATPSVSWRGHILIASSPLKKIQHKEPHGPLRAAEYPPITDQIDAIFKLAKALREQGINLPPDVTDRSEGRRVGQEWVSTWRTRW